MRAPSLQQLFGKLATVKSALTANAATMALTHQALGLIDLGEDFASVERDVILTNLHKQTTPAHLQRAALADNECYQNDPAHVVNMQLLARHFHPHLKGNFDLLKTLLLILDHDLPEAVVNDTSAAQTENDAKAKNAQHSREAMGAEAIKERIGGQTGADIHRNWYAFEAKGTPTASPEANLAGAYDKLEVIASALKYPDIRYWERYGKGDDYYKIVLSGQRRSKLCGEGALIHYHDTMVEITKLKMIAAGVDPERYVPGCMKGSHAGLVLA